MNRSPDVELVLRDYFADDGLTAPDHVLDVVESRIGRQSQRRAWPFPGRTTVTTPIKLIAAVAAALVVAVVGFSLLPDTSGPGTSGPGTPTASPTPSPQPTTATTVAPVIDLPDGTLTAGRYRIDLSFMEPGLSIVADIPAGWNGHSESAAVTGPERNSDAVLISFMLADGLFSDPCHWDLDGTGDTGQPGDVEVGPTVDDLVTALRANTTYTTSGVEPMMVSGFQATALDLQLPGDDVLTTCDQHGPDSPFDGPAYFVFSHRDGTFYAQGPNSRWHLHIVDVDGTRLITMASILEGTPQADIAAAEAILNSFEITP